MLVAKAPTKMVERKTPLLRMTVLFHGQSELVNGPAQAVFAYL